MRKVDYVKSALDSNTYEVATPEELLRLAHSEANQRVLENYRMDLSLGKGKDSPWKKLLMAIIPQAKRKDVNCPSHKAEDMVDTGFIFIDDDSDKLPAEIRYENFLNRLSELGLSDMAHVALVSASKKLHIVVPKIDQSLSVAENHDMWRGMLDGCGISMDPATKNANRLMFFVGNVLGGDLSLLFADNIPQVSPALAQHCQSQHSQEMAQDSSNADAYYGIAYIDIIDQIIKELGGEPRVGDRNNYLYRLTSELSSICDANPEWISQLLADYSWFGLPQEEAMATIRSACKAKKSGTGRQSRMLRSIISELASQPTVTTDDSLQLSNDDWSPFSDTAPAMPQLSSCPRFVRDLLSRTPSRCYEHVLNTCLPALACYLDGCTITGIDGSELKLNCGFLHCGVAKMSQGKSSRNQPLRAIIAPLKARDNELRAKIDAYNDQLRRTKASDLKESKPLFDSQLVGSDSTSSALMSRLRDLQQEKSLLITCDELQMLTALQSNTTGTAPLALLLAFSAEDWVVDRSSEMGVSGSVSVRLNVSAMGTPYQAQKFFAGGYHSGLISRFSFSTIHEDDSEFYYGDYTGFEELMAPYLELLKAEQGKHLSCKKIDEWARAMQRELLDKAAEFGCEALRNLSYRAVIIAQKKAYVFWILNKKVCNRKLMDFLTWSLRAQMHSMFYVLGDLIQKESAAEESSSTRSFGPKNLLTMLPDTFSRQDMIELRKRLSMDVGNKALSRALSAWRGRKLITDNPDGTFTNLKR